MGEHLERRRAARRPVQKQIYCYVEGQRLDAETADLSALGALVRTVWTDTVNGEALVSVSFRAREAEVRDVFLFGRVERVQNDPARGFALSWVRAVTTGPRVGLVSVLRELLGVPDDLIETQRLGADGKPNKVFHFDAPSGGGAPAGVRRPTLPSIKEARVPTSEHDWRRFPSKGPLTRAMAAAPGREAITLKALLVSGSARRNVRVTSLGEQSLSLDMKGGLEGIADTATVRFNVPLRRGVGLVAAAGRVSKSASRPAEGVSLLEITFESVDEGDRPGVLERYVRWLRQRSLGAAPGSDAGGRMPDADPGAPTDDDGNGPQ